MLKTSKECKAADKKEFCKLVVSGGEVKEVHVSNGIKRAQTLAFAHEDGVLAGVGCLKTPLQSYKRKVFRKAKSALSADSFAAELGYVSVAKDHQGKGISRQITEALLQGHKGKLFATSAAGNTRMHRTLARAGFNHQGEPYESEDEKGKMLVLFVRNEQPEG